MNNMGREIMAALKRFQVGSDGDGVTVGGSLVVSGSTTANTFSATAVNATGTVTFSGSVILSGTTTANTFSTDLITEKTSAAGVTVDGVLLKDTGVGSAASPVTLNSLAYPTEGSVNFRNRIINGDMRIDQRNAGASVSASASFVVDRFKSLENSGYSTLTLTAQQVSTTPSNFNNSIKVTVGTGQAVSADRFIVAADHRIEGYNFSDLGFGTSAAKSFTLSFWVRSSITGTYCVSFFNSAVDRAYLATYTISAIDTWEQKTITVVGDTSGTWNTTNGVGLGIQFTVSAGTNQQGTAGSWSGTYKRGVSGMADLGATSGATWYITGVQLEVGSVATPFERRPYGTELALCQRYYFQDGPYNGSFGAGCHWSTTLALYHYRLPVPMRAAPTFSVSAASDFRSVANGTVFIGSSFGASYPTPVAARLDLTISGATAGHGSVLENANTNAKLMFNSEL
jgi:hypothetical protein